MHISIIWIRKLLKIKFSLYSILNRLDLAEQNCFVMKKNYTAAKVISNCAPCCFEHYSSTITTETDVDFWIEQENVFFRTKNPCFFSLLISRLCQLQILNKQISHIRWSRKCLLFWLLSCSHVFQMRVAGCDFNNGKGLHILLILRHSFWA